MLSRRTGLNNYSEITYGSAIPVKCAVVHISKAKAKTPIRDTASASQSQADEDTETGRVLIPDSLNPRPSVGDRFVLLSFPMRFLSIEPRLDTRGNLDHWECGLEADPSAI